MRFTRRGIGLAIVVVVAFVLARAHGTRSLGAIVVPGVLALAVGLWHVRRTAPPVLTREMPADGTVGHRGTVRFTIESTDAGQLLVRDRLPDGIEAVGRSDRTATVRALSGDVTSYDVEFHARGEWTIGPAEVVVRDIFGLVERVYEFDESDPVLVYPRVRQLTATTYRELLAVATASGGDERTVFDSLREYNSGDPLRDIDWRTSAKRDELIVTEYTAGGVGGRVRIDATATPDSVDAMAESTASLVVPLLEADVPIELRLPDETVVVDGEDARAVLARLARLTLESGATTEADGLSHASESVSARDSDAIDGASAHVQIDATSEGVTVSIGGRTTAFESLLVESAATEPTPTDAGWFADQQSRLKSLVDDEGFNRWVTP